jgi:hypothetical protein
MVLYRIKYKVVGPFLVFLLSFLAVNRFWKSFSNNFSPSLDAIWNIPTAALAFGDNRFGGSPGWTIDIAGHHLPLVAGPYLGAFKSYLLSAFFLIEPNYVESSQLFNQIIFGILVAVFYLLASKFFSWIVALTITGVLFLCRGFIYSASLDYGPYLVGTLFILISSILIFGAKSKENKTKFYLGLFCLGIAIADKLTILPIALPLLLYVLFRAAKLLKDLTEYLKALTIFLIPFIPMFLYFMRNGFAELLQMTGIGSNPLPNFLSLQIYLNSLSSFITSTIGPKSPYLYNAFYGVTGENFEQYVLISIFLILAFTFFYGLILMRHEPDYFFLISWAPISLILLIPMNARPWHYQPLLPLFIISICLALKVIFIDLQNKIRIDLSKLGISRNKKALYLSSLITVLSLGALNLTSLDSSVLGSGIASPSHSAAANYIDKREKIKSLICLDYSVCVPILAMMSRHDITIKADYSFDSTFPKEPQNLLLQIATCEDALVVRKKLGELKNSYEELLYYHSRNFLASNSKADSKFMLIHESYSAGTSVGIWQKDC